MIKRIVTMVLAATMIIGLLTACCISHSWQEADCENPQICTKCQETKGEALGHSWTDATCETAKTCSTCGEVEGDPLGHQIFWSSEDRRTTMQGVCSTCDTSFEEPVDWTLLGPCDVQDTWECVDAPVITLTVNADGTALLDTPDESFNLTWEYDSLGETLMGTVVNFQFYTEDGAANKGVLVTIIDNMFMLAIGNNIYTFAR